MSAIERAVKAAGGSKGGLASSIGVSPQFLSQWLTGSRPVPAKHCIAIETATGGEVTRYDLRPDIFGSAPPAEDSRQ